MSTESLLHEFPPVTTEAWEEAIARDLKGADYSKKLIWQSGEGLAVKPYYRADDVHGLEYLDVPPGEFPFARGARSTGGWRIREEIGDAAPEQANRAAQRAVAAGAEEIAFRGLTIANASDLNLALVNLKEIPIRFACANESLLLLLLDRGSQPLSTGFDPFANLDFAAEIATGASPGFIPFTIHGEDYEESGATAADEVGFALAAGVDLLAEMQARKVPIHRAAATIEFSLSIGAGFYFQIAKLRAFRALWARAVESFGGSKSSSAARIHARTSRWNKTVYDSHVNVLRGTTEAISAVLGGADSISVAPFDECYKVPGEASRRLARNTQILLKQEAHLALVADPAGGSYCIEVLTDFIARKAWKTLQSIEAAGGYRQARSSGQVVHALDQSLAARNEAVLARRRVFTGTNQYANLAEKALDRIDETCMHSSNRGARPFEELRLRTERHAAKSGSSPLIVLAEIGEVKMRSARSGFAAGFFGCAGFNVVTQRFTTADEIAATGADLIVLCSSDPEYLPLATDLLPKLSALGRAVPVIVAGNPETFEQLRAAGVADFVHIRTNPIEFLTRWQKNLGVEG